MTDGRQLLAQYVEAGSEAAFRELVSRYVDLVFSAAVRLVNGDVHMAEDVTQTVFADLARMAGTLARDVMLGGWLHRHTCFVASNTRRGNLRRQERERQAVEMNASEDHSAANLAQLAPVLDDAIDQLDAEDRAAIMLRFFEQNDFRTVGEALGSSEEAARKRVDRALEKLEGLLKRRGVALPAVALAAALGAQAVTAAPAGLAASVSTVALTGAAAGGGTTVTILKIMSMTKLKAGIITAVIIAGVAVPWTIRQRADAELKAVKEALQEQAETIKQLKAENAKLVAAKKATPPPAKSGTNDQSLELMRLRAEVGRLHQETAGASAAVAKVNGPSAVGGLKANPEMWKVIRDQQKMGMTMIYKGLTNHVNLSTNQVEKLNEVLADHVMDNIDRITEVLRDKLSVEQMDQVFTAQEAALMDKVAALLGPEGAAQYKDYTHNIASYLTAEQFKSMMTGEKAEKEEKGKQLYALLKDETQQALAAAGLPPDYQTVPTLNFRNIASESEAEKNLALLDGIYKSVAGKAGAFLSEAEIKKFGEFRTMAINGNRAGLTLNRKLMAPGSN